MACTALGRLIAEFPIMMFALIRNIKSKLMVRVAFVLFFPTSIAHNVGIYIITVLRENHIEIIFMRTCLTVRCFVYWSHGEFSLSPSFHFSELDYSNKWSLPGILTLLILSAEPSPVHIIGTLKRFLCCFSIFVGW